ncbi:MAG: amidohydrolase family protein [Acidobacteria bacterium]|nr:amidohydrolase family protein [Acidobacteriota bacterium]
MKLRISIRGWLWLLMLVGGLAPNSAQGQQQAQNLPPEVIAFADMVLYNGRIYTADEQFSVAEAVAIRDGKFLSVGGRDKILAMAGPKTRRVDLRGRSVVPGFIDTHLHSAFVGETSKAGTGGEVQFRDVPSGLEELKAIAAKYPAGTELYIKGPSNKPLVVDVTLAQLDAATPNHPLAITCPNNQVVVNSLMLKKLPPDTPGIRKDDSGKPNGQIRGGAAGRILYEGMTWPDVEKEVARQKEVFHRFVTQGLTTIMGRAQGLSFTIFRELWKQGELEPRVRAIHEFLRQNAEPEAYLKRLGNLTDFGDEQLKIIGATVQVVDGSTGPGAGHTTKGKIKMAADDPYGPYGENKWEDTGDVSTSDRRNIILANRYGWSILGLHSSGDASNDLLLETFAEAHQERSLVGRHFGIDHGLMWKPRHFDKIKAMDVVPSLYSKALYENDRLIEMYGADEVNNMQPVRSMIDAGIQPAAEADAFSPRTSAPLFNIQKWVTRLDDRGRLFNVSEKIDRKEALYMYTLWAARYSGEQDILGSIEVGKLADLVVLGGDYMTFPEADLDKLRILMTVVGGKAVHEVAGAF